MRGKPFDVELFLAAVLTGSQATRFRHLKRAKVIQAERAERWQPAPDIYQAHLKVDAQHNLESANTLRDPES
ncbi:hypothetical protein PchlR47_04070 [Pseudomonas chlororaphis]|nr:hypothetical protein PchlR47_04070 [Pseudomonas chlororaphis]